ncbi:MAG: DNA polymerase III subunit gamma/tau [Patescibacteria group bacterium]
MATLYQKYRPNNFEEIVNQNHIKITLQNEVETGQLAHAYLFSGPRGTGKTTMARVLSKSLNCEKREDGKSEPCGECHSCEQIKKGTSLDIIEIDAASHTGVDNVRDNIIASARVGASHDKFRVFIIDEVHMLSISAFNALLKILEEPPRNIIFILATTELHKLPTTIISRCQRFDFKRISVNDIVLKLNYICGKEGIKIGKGILETIARQSEGHMRDAESLLGQVISISGKEITQEKADLVIPRSNLNSVVDLIGCITNKNSIEAIRLINQLIDEGVDLAQFTQDMIEILRRIMLAKISAGLAEKFAQDLGQNLEEKIAPIAQKATVEKLVEIINIFSEARQELKNSFVVQMPLEIAVITLCGSSGQPKQNFSAPDAGASVNQSVSHYKPVNLEEVKAKWNELLLAIKKYNHSLSFILKVCELREDNGILCLVFKYKFHQDRVEQANIKQLILKAFQEVYKTPMQFSTLLDENLEVNNVEIIEEKPAEPEKEPAAGLTEDKNNINNTGGKKEKKEIVSGEGVDNILKMFGGKIMS